MDDSHGGNIDSAIRNFGGIKEKWLDLSTGINPYNYPIKDIDEKVFKSLPTKNDIFTLNQIAKNSYETKGSVQAIAGIQTAINLLPFLLPEGSVKILEPTYNEFSRVFLKMSRKVLPVKSLEELRDSDISILCNPNNPDGKIYSAQELLYISQSVKILIVDESFIDQYAEMSLCSQIKKNTENIIILRSFGKFYGLAGLRLGFIISGEKFKKKVDNLIGPWPVSSEAIFIAANALVDYSWKAKTIKKLKIGTSFLDSLSKKLNWKIEGGTDLFRLYKTPNAKQVQYALAKNKIWTRKFSYSKYWIRISIPHMNKFRTVEEAYNYLCSSAASKI